MKPSWLLLVVALLILQFIPVTVQDEHGLKLEEQTNLNDGGAKLLDSPADDIPAEESEQPRRIRGRGGTKRRRRLKKRLRTTTVLPFDEDSANVYQIQKINGEDSNLYAAQSQDEQTKVLEVGTTAFPIDETTILPLPRKRTLKRRRKPSRKHQHNGPLQQDPNDQEKEAGDAIHKPPRRRRKGGRRRMRPRLETTEMPKIETYEESTIMNIDAEVTTLLYDTPKILETHSNKAIDDFRQGNAPVYTTNIPDQESALVSQASVDPIDSQNIGTTAIPKVISRQRVYSSKPFAKPYKPLKEFVLESNDASRVVADSETNEVPSQAPTEPTSTNYDYGSKTFDRKALFSKSRKLPVTSAIIRKKLTPRQQAEAKKAIQLERIETEASVRHELHKLLPDGYTVQPQVMEPSKLLERLKEHSNTYRTTTNRPITEEPNYPKFESKKKLKIVSISVETTSEVVTEDTPAEKSTVRYEFPSEQTTLIEHNSIAEETTEFQSTTQRSTTQRSTPTTEIPDTQDSEPTLNVTNDSIVELLKTDSGHEKLTQILESRNMTVAQLLEHRQRGSSKFHLADIFAARKSISGKNTTESMSSDQEELGTPLYPEKQTILFPSEEVLGSFPAFISNKIEAVKKEATPASSESREPRVFSSMPEFANTRKEDEKLPPWKVPNPKLRPVNVRGNIEEIKISLKPIADKAEVLRTNRVASTLEADPITAENSFNRFRRIPVTVKSAIIISTAILILAIFGFLSVLISCRMRQKRERLRAKQDILCEHLKNEDFMNSQQSLSPVLTKQQGRGAVFTTQNNIQSNTTSNRHYYLWQTLRKTLQHD